MVDANTITLSATLRRRRNNLYWQRLLCSVFGFVTMSVGGGTVPILVNLNSISLDVVCQPFQRQRSKFVRDLIYDATFGAFYDPGSTLGSYSVPPEVCLDLCYKLGAHPWFVTPMLACDPVTDWLTQLGTLIQTTYQNGKARG